MRLMTDTTSIVPNATNGHKNHQNDTLLQCQKGTVYIKQDLLQKRIYIKTLARPIIFLNICGLIKVWRNF